MTILTAEHGPRSGLRVIPPAQPDGALPPQDREAEARVLGALLLGGENALRAVEARYQLTLKDAHFDAPQHSLIWRAIVGLMADGHPVSSADVHSRLAARGELDAAGGDDCLLSLCDTIPAIDALPLRRLEQLRQARITYRTSQRVRQASVAVDLEGARAALESGIELLSASDSAVTWRETPEIFAALPEPKWLARGLHIGPGRPALLAGYGASAKTLSAQQLALALASGTPAWEFFETTRAPVRHLDYEQGWHATARRYQRLAVGHRIELGELGDRLKLAVFPSVFLDSPGAVDAYARLCEGAGLVILDALRGATPSQDENDSSIRVCLDNLSRVSEKTGAAFVVLHHAGKPKEGHSDARTIARGSSAIFDACGCVLVVTPGKTKDEPRKVSQVKQPAEAEGGALEDFTLTVEDFTVGTNPTAGVRVLYKSTELANPTIQANARFERLAARVLEVVHANPGASQNTIVSRAGLNRSDVLSTLATLVDEGRLALLLGSNKAKTYRAAGPR